MSNGFYNAVVSELKNLGYRYLETNRHEVWQNGDGHKVTVPFNLKSRHTANGILKDAGSTLHL
ncbi:type II toxin-antitoxin system HicA family toxin [Devosia sp.]|uniref:type II toxin-antitoxin system HicA family toxin n=1 Tax=Devosia sp. TaxID=1871048 RepID=UPI0035B1F892